MKNFSLPLIALLFLSGCASTPKLTWTHPTMTQAEADKESYDCDYKDRALQATRNAGIHDNVDAQWYVLGAIIDKVGKTKSEYQKCMESKGFVFGAASPSPQSTLQSEAESKAISSVPAQPYYAIVDTESIPMNGEGSTFTAIMKVRTIRLASDKVTCREACAELLQGATLLADTKKTSSECIQADGRFDRYFQNELTGQLYINAQTRVRQTAMILSLESLSGERVPETTIIEGMTIIDVVKGMAKDLLKKCIAQDPACTIRAFQSDSELMLK